MWKKWVGWVLLALSLYLVFEGWRISQPTEETKTLSRTTACEGRDDCTLEHAEPHKIKTDFFGRAYEWTTSKGPVTVSCRKAAVFWGAWQCTARDGTM